MLRHAGGALSSVVASQAVQRYRRPGLELYGTEGSANLLGDDWDPRGLEVWRNERGAWELREPLDATWLWADGLRELVVALAEGRPPLTALDLDLHLLDVLDAARRQRGDGQRGRGRLDVRAARPAPRPGRRATPPARPHAARPTSSRRRPAAAGHRLDFKCT